MKKNGWLKRFTALLLVVAAQQNSRAEEISQTDDKWRFFLKGCLQTDLIHDSTRSFRDFSGNAPVARPGTFDGDNSRAQVSVRNSRLFFNAEAPEENGLKQGFLLAVDFLGYDPDPSTAPPRSIETSFYSNPTPRMLLGIYNLETDHWNFLAGLGGSLFGWEPKYFLATASFVPMSGAIYVRPPQLTAIRKLDFEGGNKMQVGISVTRPTQRDSGTPNVDAGIRYTFGERKAAYAVSFTDVGMETASVALSSTYRQFLVPDQSTTATKSNLELHGSGVAFDTMLPLVAAGEEGSLIMTAEYTVGTGYTDNFAGITGNIAQLPTGAAPSLSSVTNLDPGLGGYDASGTFHLASLQTWNTQFQYHLPASYHSFMTAGYALLGITNSEKFVSLAGQVLYDKAEGGFINFYHDVTSRVRVAVEYDKFSTHYVDGVSATDHRFQFSTYIRF